MSLAELEKSLGHLTELSGVTRALLVQSDGLLIAQRSAGGDDAAEVQSAVIRVAAMTATAISLNKRIIGALGGGVLSETSIIGSEGKISLYAVGTRVVLALVTSVDADAGPIAERVEKTLEVLSFPKS